MALLHQTAQHNRPRRRVLRDFMPTTSMELRMLVRLLIVPQRRPAHTPSAGQNGDRLTATSPCGIRGGRTGSTRGCSCSACSRHPTRPSCLARRAWPDCRPAGLRGMGRRHRGRRLLLGNRATWRDQVETTQYGEITGIRRKQRLNAGVTVCRRKERVEQSLSA
jgi:hypothetical protein